MFHSFGVFQHQRVKAVGYAIAAERGHEPLRLEVKPSFANQLLWKVIYELEDSYYTDAVRAGPEITIYRGERITKLDIDRDLPWLDPDSQQARDLEPDHSFTYNLLGGAYAGLMDFSQSLSMFQEAQRRDPDSVLYYSSF